MCYFCTNKQMKYSLKVMRDGNNVCMFDNDKEEFLKQYAFLDGSCGQKMCQDVLKKLDCQSYVMALNNFIIVNCDEYPSIMDFKEKLIDISAQHSILIHAKNDTRIATIEANSPAALPLSQNDTAIASALQTAVDNPNYMRALKADAKRRKNLNAMKSIIKKKKKSAMNEIDDIDDDVQNTPRRLPGRRRPAGHLPPAITPTGRTIPPALLGDAGGSRQTVPEDLDELTARALAAPLPPFNTGFPTGFSRPLGSSMEE